MRDQLEEALHVATDNLQVPWEKPDELRRRASRRRKWLLASAALLSVLALAAAGRFTLVYVVGQPDPLPHCSEEGLMLPESEAEVVVAVYNATVRVGLAEEVATQLRNRRFQVTTVGQTTEQLSDDAVAAIRYGPLDAGKAHILRAYLRDQAVDDFDRMRSDGTVDLILGPRFVDLATPNEMRQQVARMGRPEVPC